MAMNFEKDLLVKELVHLEDAKNMKSWVNSLMFTKNSEKSREIRKQGNKLFDQNNHSSKVHEEIWKLYSQSIAYALIGSKELAASYANRSALLLHLHKYEDCLIDIDRALKITSLDALKVKLFCRQTECLVALQDEKKMGSLAKAKYWLNKLDDNMKGKKALTEMVEKVEKSLETNFSKVKTSEKIPDIKVPNNAVHISYNSKMGRGLVASQDFKVGEFICKEKLYAVSCNNKKLYAYCSHCLSISWTAVPCDSCSYYMYCGEKCKEEAWQKYHDIECSLHITVDTYLEYYSQMSIRLFIQGFKEAGSIQNLKNMLKEIDECTDEKTKGFSQDGKFLSDSFRSIYSLRSAKASENIKTFAGIALYNLNALVKNSSIPGLHSNSVNIKTIKENNNLLFVGTLLLRLNLIMSLNAFHVIDPNFNCKKDLNPLMCAVNCCCPKGMGFSPFLSLINHSCDANVSKLFTTDGNVVYYALKPIPKGTQLYFFYNYCYYAKLEKRNRKEILKDLYEFNCECTACKHNFPVADSQLTSEADGKMDPQDFFKSYAIFKKYEFYINLIETKSKHRRFSVKILHDFTRDMDDLLRNAKRPAFYFQSFINILMIMMSDIYSTKLHVPRDYKP